MRRVSIAGLMVAIGVVAVAIAALRNASEVWTGVLLSVTLVVLACSAFGVAYRRGAARAGWFGFAVFGWGYLALTLGPWDRFQSSLPTSRALVYAHGQLFPPEVYSVVSEVVPSPTGSGPGVMTVRTMKRGDASASVTVNSSSTTTSIRRVLGFGDNLRQFEQIGHCLLAFVVGLVGALIARWFHRGAEATSAMPEV
jgi:hypothetical protein